jgi:undecaprenyl-diphosphatase
MAFTRVYVGAHYPLDMVAGLAVGAVIAAAVVLTASRSTTAVVRRLERTRLRPLLTAAV